MQISRLWQFGALALLSTFAHAQNSWDTPRLETLYGQTQTGVRYVLDEALILLEPGADRDEVLTRLTALGTQCLGEVPRLGVLRMQRLSGEDITNLLAQLAAVQGVSSAEYNGVGEGGGRLLTPDDTHFQSQWHHENTSANAGTPGADIESVAAWKITTGSDEVTIAILDSGIDFGHPDFQGRLLPGFDFVNEDSDPTADHPHGISVTGLAAANGNNTFGIAGVDWACQILPVKVLNQFNGGTVMDLLQGLDYCAERRAQIVSMSLINYPGTSALVAALAGAREAGCILISCGANNAGAANSSWPGASPDTITIAASTPNDSRASFSGFGTSIDFSAPGASVATSAPSQADSFNLFSGCSAATPVAAGIVGLLAARHPLLTQDQAYELLRLGAEDQVGDPNEDTPGYDIYHGHGRLNARSSLEVIDLDPSVIGYTCLPAAVNSSGQSAHIVASGSIIPGFDDLELTVSGLPSGQFGHFLMGDGFAVSTPPGSNGQLCIQGGQIVRLIPPILSSGASGSFRAEIGTLNLPVIGDIQPGNTWTFQAWFRDGIGSNFSDALSVLFE